MNGRWKLSFKRSTFGFHYKFPRSRIVRVPGYFPVLDSFFFLGEHSSSCLENIPPETWLYAFSGSTKQAKTGRAYYQDPSRKLQGQGLAGISLGPETSPFLPQLWVLNFQVTRWITKMTTNQPSHIYSFWVA